MKNVNEVCKDFFISHEVSYFSFLRYYKDNTATFFFTQSGPTIDWLENDYPFGSGFDAKYSITQNFSYAWDEIFSDFWLSLLRGKHSLYNGITLISRHKNYWDETTFAMEKPHTEIVSFYLNYYKDFYNFSEEFAKKTKNYIKQTLDIRLVMPKISQCNHYPKLYIPTTSSTSHQSIKGLDGKNSYITAFEAFCLQLFQQGKSYKEIGIILEISDRTVETYFLRLRDRTGYSMNFLYSSFFLISANIDMKPVNV